MTLSPTLALVLGCYDNDVKLADLQEQVEALEARLAEAEATAADAQARVAALESTVVTAESLEALATSEELAAETAAREAADAALQAQLDDFGLAYTPIVYYTALQAQVDALEVSSGDAIVELATLIADEEYAREASDSAIITMLADYALYADVVALADAAALSSQSYADAGDDALDTRLTSVEDDYLVADDLSDVVMLISVDTTLEVPADYATLEDAVAWLDRRSIAHDATVTISVADGTYVLTDTLVLSHRDGSRVQIVGNTSDPALVDLYFSGVTGIEVPAGRDLGYIDGVTIRGSGASETYGIYAHDGAFVACGPSVVVEGFGSHGFYAYRSGVIVAPETESSSNGGSGYYADVSSVAHITSAQAFGNAGSGIAAVEGSVVLASYAEATAGGGAGFYAAYSSHLRMQSAVSTGNSSYGVYGYNASVYAYLAEIATNSDDGAFGNQMSWLYLRGATIDANGDYGVEVSKNSIGYVEDAAISNHGQYGAYSNMGSIVYRGNASFSSNAAGSYSPSPQVDEPEGSYVY